MSKRWWLVVLSRVVATGEQVYYRGHANNSKVVRGLPVPRFSKTFLEFLSKQPQQSPHSHEKSSRRRSEHRQVVTELQYMIHRVGRVGPAALNEEGPGPGPCGGSAETRATSVLIEVAELEVCLGLGWERACDAACKARDGNDGYDVERVGGLSPLEACCAAHAVLSGWSCDGRREACYATVVQRVKHGPRSFEGTINVAIAGGAVDAAGIVAAARSAFDASSEPSRVRAYVVTDAEGSELARLEAALACSLGGYAYKVASATRAFLEARSPAFARMFGAEAVNRTRPNLVKAPANYARIYLDELFAELRGKLVIYLDCDVLVNADPAILAIAARRALDDPAAYFLKEEEQRGVRPAVAATLKTASHDDYGKVWRRRFPFDMDRKVAVFNSGVMIFDFDRWRSQALSAEVERWIDVNLIGGSQLPINLAVANNFAKLDAVWNCAIRTGDADDAVHIASEACTKSPAIRHWTGRAKPWLRNGRLPFFWFPQAHRLRPCLQDLYDPPT
ncbi:hypothetical protein CTAYLR_007606 [Chrysophaeum taylorii]|uniref:Hexosyltransferase n=1 Tax=Chrysophaeum taylorii TaxID=2483200 RepID=A0AAD7U6C0_9STRA|nr:hypothetical protein CTAYLR_007606 [Chrysophaeum taylorii]